MVERVSWVSGALFAAVAALPSCGDDSKCAGVERCPCYANKTCDAGLMCLSNVCVTADSGNAGEANSLGEGGGGGTPNNGGSSSTVAGKSGTGGNSSAGRGGTSPAGGTESVGGTFSNGGSSGASGGSSAGPNLIKNGDFSLGEEYWEVTWQDGDVAAKGVLAGEYCIQNPSATLYLSYSLGFPPTPSDAFAIEAGASYTLSYRAMIYDNFVLAGAVTPKIGQAVTPYAPVAEFLNDPVTGVYTTFSHVVTSPGGEPQAGLVFNGELDNFATICFDDVAFVKN